MENCKNNGTSAGVAERNRSVSDTGFNEMQRVKRHFFALRNGVIADTMRKAGSSFKIIFGLVLPQIEEVARTCGYDTELSRRLWDNKSTRESMLLAPMLIDPATFCKEDAVAMAEESPSTEIADNLVHKLLRKMPDSFTAAEALCCAENEMCRYCGMRLLWHHISSHQEDSMRMAQAELLRDCQQTRQPAQAIVDEINFMNEV